MSTPRKTEDFTAVVVGGPLDGLRMDCTSYTGRVLINGGGLFIRNASHYRFDSETRTIQYIEED